MTGFLLGLVTLVVVFWTGLVSQQTVILASVPWAIGYWSGYFWASRTAWDRYREREAQRIIDGGAT